MIRIVGFDPGLRITGWGIIDTDGNRLRHVAHGTVTTDGKADLAGRLLELHAGIGDVIARFGPDEAAVEQNFANQNPTSTMKLGQARGMALLAPAQAGLTVAEYLPNLVKKTVVGTGHAAKQQIQAMVATLLPGVEIAGADAADALAVAICHAHHRQAVARTAELEKAAT